jgi:formyltetrahydrofolate hydrolase
MGSRTHFCNIILDTTPISRQNVRKVDDHIDFYRTAFNGKTCLKGFDFTSVRT